MSKNIILVIADSTRPDHLNCYGYPRQTSPNIDKLATQGVRFENVLSPSVWTPPSHISLFSGLYPSEHNIITYNEGRDIRIPSTLITLPDLFAKQGYATGGFSNNPWIGRLTDLHKRFDTYIESNMSVSQGDFQPKLPLSLKFTSSFGKRFAKLRFQIILSYLQKRPVYTRTTLQMVCNWIRQQEKPFFCFINLMDAHQPFYPPREDLNLFSGSKHGWYRMAKMNVKFRDAFSGKIELNSDQKQLLNDYYDANIRHMDWELNDLFEFLESENKMNETLIIFTADHGKILGEYPRSESIHYMSDVNIRVPLIIRGLENFSPGEVVKGNIELLCLFETLNRLFRLNAPERYGMRTLQEAANQQKPIAFAEASLPYVRKLEEEGYLARCLRSEKYKYIETNQGDVYLYDIIHDSLEKENIADKEPHLVDCMHSRLEKHLEGMNINTVDLHGNGNEINVDVKERLRGLGYLD